MCFWSPRPIRTSLIACCSLALVGAAPAAAEAEATLPAGARPLRLTPTVPVSVSSPIATSSLADNSVSVRHDETFAARATLAGLGWLVGAYVGLRSGPSAFGADCGGCDDPGLGSAILGGALGSAVAAKSCRW